MFVPPYPLVLIPSFLVPASILLHLASLAKLVGIEGASTGLPTPSRP